MLYLGSGYIFSIEQFHNRGFQKDYSIGNGILNLALNDAYIFNLFLNTSAISMNQVFYSDHI